MSVQRPCMYSTQDMIEDYQTSAARHEFDAHNYERMGWHVVADMTRKLAAQLHTQADNLLLHINTTVVDDIT